MAGRRRPARSLDFFGVGTTKVKKKKPRKKAEEAVSRKRRLRSEEIDSIRKRLRIKVSAEAAAPWASWDELFEFMGNERVEGLRRGLEASAWAEPTAVQMQACPTLARRRDVVVCAPTGSGKSGAFLVPILAVGASAVIVAPTRELCAQLSREARKLGRFVADPPSIEVCTPVRAAAFEGDADFVVVDEADRLLDAQSGSLEALDAALAARPDATKAFFSATVPPAVDELADSALRDPLRIRVLGAGGTSATDAIEQRLVFAGDEKDKLAALRDLVRSGTLKVPCLVFVDTADRACDLARELAFEGLRAEALHAARRDRPRLLNEFRAGTIWFLVATDLASRGLDLKALNSVCNFDIPRTAADYLHRIGRVGRAGRPGLAVTLYTDKDAEDGPMRSVANLANLSSNGAANVPDWLLKLKKKARTSSGVKSDEKETAGKGDNKRRRAPARPRLAPIAKFLVDKIRNKRASIRRNSKKLAARDDE